MPNRPSFTILQSLLLAFVTLLVARAVALAQTEFEFAKARSVMVEADLAAAGIKDRAILAVMRDVPRHRFLPIELQRFAYYDMSLPIGEGQTISPPFIVAQMTQRLAIKPDDNVLEIGTGSGYQAAILSRLVKEVHTIEIVELLAKRAGEVFKQLGYGNIHARVGDGYQGWPEAAPFDKIIVTCSPERVPQPLVEQLREGGRIVIPVGERYQQLLVSFAKQDGKLVVESREPTYFVPMTGQAESLREKLADGAVTGVINGDFEQLLEPGVPAGWYYVRQAAFETSPTRIKGKQCIHFSSAVAGWNSQALQSIGVDGREVNALAVELWVQARGVRKGEYPSQQAQLLVSFFNEDRVPLGQAAIDPWQGSFDWTRKHATIAVPPDARGAMIALGLLGATGDLWCDDVTIRPQQAETARK